MASYSQIDFILASADGFRDTEVAPDLKQLPISETKMPSTGWEWVILPEWARDLVPNGLLGLYLQLKEAPHAGGGMIGGRHF